MSDVSELSDENEYRNSDNHGVTKSDLMPRVEFSCLRENRPFPK